MTAPTNTLVDSPPGSHHHHRWAKADINANATTIASHIVAGNLQAWPTTVGDIIIASSEGASDAGRRVICSGVDGEYAEMEEIVTLDAAGSYTLEGWLDVYRMGDRTNDPAAAVGEVTATKSGVVLCEFTPEYGQSQSTRHWIPDGFTGYVQSIKTDFDQRIDELALWVWPIRQTWRAITSLLAGSGTNAGRDLGRDYTSPTCWGLRVQGPCRIEIRAQTNSGNGTLAAEYTLLVVPNEHARR